MGRRSHTYIQTAIPDIEGDFQYVSDTQRSLLWRTARSNGWDADDVKDAIADVQKVSFDAASVKTLLAKHFQAVLERLSQPANKPQPVHQLKLL